MASESTIGSGTTIRGSIRGDGDLDIHGRVEGSVTVTGELLIAETALIRSDVSARRVVVRGAVLGNISADEVIVLEAGARVVGDLGAPQIGIRPGGLVRGNVSTEGPLSDYAPTAEPATMARQRTSPKAASVVMAPTGRAAPFPAARGPAALAAKPVAPARAPARQAPPPPARAVSVGPLPAPRPPPPALARPFTAGSPGAGASPAPASWAETSPPHTVPGLGSPATTASPGGATATHTDTAQSAPVGPSISSMLTEHEHEHDSDEDVTGMSEPDDAGGPPPPVVPALRKGAKASLRRKSAR